MTKVRVHTISVSLDGYMAGPHQNLYNPIGEGGRLRMDLRNESGSRDARSIRRR